MIAQSASVETRCSSNGVLHDHRRGVRVNTRGGEFRWPL